jgi:hypothetical protein
VVRQFHFGGPRNKQIHSIKYWWGFVLALVIFLFDLLDISYEDLNFT